MFQDTVVLAHGWMLRVVQLTVLCRQFISAMLLFGIRDKEHAECRAWLQASSLLGTRLNFTISKVKMM